MAEVTLRKGAYLSKDEINYISYRFGLNNGRIKLFAETAKHFEKLVQPILAKVQVLRDQINNAKQARDRLLPKLMSGELEV